MAVHARRTGTRLSLSFQNGNEPSISLPAAHLHLCGCHRADAQASSRIALALELLTTHRAARQRFITLREVGLRFACGGHILRTCTFQNLFRSFRPLRVIAVDGEQISTSFDPSFVPLSLVLRDTHADEGPRNPT